MINRNTKAVVCNPYQTNTQRVLTVCSGGVLRSPTAAHLLCRDPYNFNTRSCGTEDYALIKMTEELVYWADTIICANYDHLDKVEAMIKYAYIDIETYPIIHTLGIPDDFDYMDPELVDIMNKHFKEIFEK